MILVGNRRGGAAELAAHLMNVTDNDHVHIHEMRGFIFDDLDGALHEVYGISRGTRCKKFLYSLSLSPPETQDVPIDAFEAAIADIEDKLGFSDQPRAIVFHEKKGRRHAHVVWSRISSATMTAIDPFQDKLSFNEIGHALYKKYGWDMPNGFNRKEDADPLNYSHAEHSQANRAKRDTQELKRIFAQSWQQSDSKPSFATALKEHGLILAKGDRRGFVAVDRQGEVYSVARWIGIKTKEVRKRLGHFDDLPSVDEALHQFGTDEAKDHTQTDRNEAYQTKLSQLEDKRSALVSRHREEREMLERHHETRRLKEIKARSAQLPTRLKSAWYKLSGRYDTIIKGNELDADRCNQRDRTEYQSLIELQLQERRLLQVKLEQLHREYDIASQQLETDPRQKLVISPYPSELTIKAMVKKDPAHILNVITDKQEEFSRSDIVRGLATFITDPMKLGIAVDTVMRCNNLVEIQSKPLPIYSTAEMLKIKAVLKTHIAKLSSTNGQHISEHLIKSAISKQNMLLKASVGAGLSREQEMAIRHCLDPEKISAVVGLAGSGKSTMLAAVHDAYVRQGFNVIGAALSRKAADGLESSSGIKSRTLASLEKSWQKGFNQVTTKDVLIIDEAGMIGTRQMLRFITEAKKKGAKIILVGDLEQLQPINAGAPFKEIADQIDTARLSEIHRQQEDWQKQASLDFAEQRIEQALNAYDVNGNIKEYRDHDEAISSLVNDYMIDISSTVMIPLALR